MTMPHTVSMLALTVAVIASLAGVHGHATMMEPEARQICAADRDSTGYTKSTGWGAGSTRPAKGGFPGICGDPFSPRPGEPDTISSFNTKPCAPVATYSQGQTITVRLTMPAYHGGFIQIRICPEADTNPSQACFDANILKLAGTDREDYWLVKHEGEGYEEVWDVDLPAGVSCPGGCMLQFVWWTAHLCMPKACTEGEAICSTYVDGQIPFVNRDDTELRDGKDICTHGLEPPFGEAPQMFINCADIIITGDGGSGNAPQAPTAAPLAPAEAPLEATVEATAEMDAPEPADDEEYEILPMPEEAEPAAMPAASGPMPRRGGPPSSPPSTPPLVEAPETMPDMMLISQLVVRDMSDQSLSPLGATITLADYPEGFSIRAEAADPDDIKEVKFETDTDLSSVERVEHYDMFSNRGSWPDPTPGPVTLTVTAEGYDEGSSSHQLVADITFV